jgi:hypothetical protein
MEGMSLSGMERVIAIFDGSQSLGLVGTAKSSSLIGLMIVQVQGCDSSILQM